MLEMIYFNPQGPRGPRLYRLPQSRPKTRFQSTRPSRASTQLCRNLQKMIFISIHKALAGLDIIRSLRRKRVETFQSTRPSRASTYSAGRNGEQGHISIHKALAGLDQCKPVYKADIRYFNPQGPRGPRPQRPFTVRCIFVFQSTRPSRASTLDRFITEKLGIKFQSTRPSRAST